MDYQKIYNELIEKARSEDRDRGKGGTYYEAHHIVPKCMGGEGKCSEWKTHPNIVLLTAKEHFYAHYYLTKTYPDNPKLIHAFWGMCNQKSNGQRPERDYSEIERFAEMYEEGRINLKHSEETRAKMSKPKSEEARAKMSAAKIGKYQPHLNTPEAIAKRSEAKKGKTHSEDTKAKMSLVKEGKPSKRRLKVDQFSKEGNFIKTWDSITQAQSSLGIAHGSIGACCKGKLKSAGGYIWKLEQG